MLLAARLPSYRTWRIYLLPYQRTAGQSILHLIFLVNVGVWLRAVCFRNVSCLESIISRVALLINLVQSLTLQTSSKATTTEKERLGNLWIRLWGRDLIM